MKNQMKGLRKLSTEEMEKVKGGGDGCPGIQSLDELGEVMGWLIMNNHLEQLAVIYRGFFLDGSLQFSPSC